MHAFGAVNERKNTTLQTPGPVIFTPKERKRYKINRFRFFPAPFARGFLVNGMLAMNRADVVSATTP
jgi:hypothetical protein